MKEFLMDYSGKFDPEFSHDKFHSETLLKLLNMYSKFIHRIDGTWFLTVLSKWGNEKALECDFEVLKRIKIWELDTICDLLNIHGNDVATMMKATQASPWLWSFETKVELVNNNHAIFTHPYCPTLIAMEKEGTGREKSLCQGVELKIFEMTAHYFNKNIKLIPLHVPPRKDKNGIACQWELKLEP